MHIQEVNSNKVNICNRQRAMHDTHVLHTIQMATPTAAAV